MLRLFVGFELPEPIIEELKSMASGVADARRIDPKNLHMTLRFIDGVEEDEAEEIDIALRSIGAPSFSLYFERVGCFQSRERVHQIWAGAEKEQALAI